MTDSILPNNQTIMWKWHDAVKEYQTENKKGDCMKFYLPDDKLYAVTWPLILLDVSLLIFKMEIRHGISNLSSHLEK